MAQGTALTLGKHQGGVGGNTQEAATARQPLDPLRWSHLRPQGNGGGGKELEASGGERRQDAMIQGRREDVLLASPFSNSPLSNVAPENKITDNTALHLHPVVRSHIRDMYSLLQPCEVSIVVPICTGITTTVTIQQQIFIGHSVYQASI